MMSLVAPGRRAGRTSIRSLGRTDLVYNRRDMRQKLAQPGIAEMDTKYSVLLLISIVLCLGMSGSRAATPTGEGDGSGDASVIPVALDGLGETLGSAQQPLAFQSGSPGALLVDRSHGQNFDIHTFAETLEAQGWTVDEVVQGPLDFELLQLYDVLVVPVRTTDVGIDPFSDKEIEAVWHYLEGGAGLWLFHEYSANPEGVNSLALTLGVEYKDTVVEDPVDHGGGSIWPNIRELSGHPVSAEVGAFRHMAGCSMIVSEPSKIVAVAGKHASAYDCPVPPPVLAAQSSAGRVVFSCDITPLHPDYFAVRLTEDELRLLENIIAWLSESDPVPTSSTSWGGLKGQFLPREGG